MAHRTFFSFHYEHDVQRASVVRKSSEFTTSITPDWIDASLWEKARIQSDAAVQKLIDYALLATTVTVVLIGTETANRKWIKYEIAKSQDRSNALIGIYIHNIRDFNGKTATKGANPLPYGTKTYDWINDDGYNNLGSWVDDAFDSNN